MEEKLRELAGKYSLPLEKVKEKYEYYLREEKREPREERALQRTRLSLKRATRATKNLATYEGIVIGVTDLADFVERMRQKALRLYQNESTRDEAITKGYVSIDGTPLDYRPTIYGRPNPNYGKPLSGHSFQRDYYIIAREQGSEEETFYTLSANNKIAPTIEVPRLFKPLSFQAGKSSTDSSRLNATSLTTFLEKDSELEDSRIEELLRTKMPCYRASEVEELLQSLDPKERYTQIIAVEGMVLTEALATKRRYIDIDDSDMEGYIRCFLSEAVEVNFGEDSRVYVIGTPGFSRGGRGVILSAYGVFSPMEDRYPLE